MGVRGALSAVLLATMVAACDEEEAPPEWTGACEEGVARVTGELGGQAIDFAVSENYGYQISPALWAWLIDDGVRLTVVDEDLGNPAVGPSRGVFVLGADEPLHCGTRDTYIFQDPPRGQLRTLTRLGRCPGTEPIAGTIEGCTGGSVGCRVSGGPLPEGGAEIRVASFSQDGTEYEFQLELGDGRVFDFDSARAGGTVFYGGEVICTDEVTVAPVGETFEFTFGGLTRLGRCEEGEAVSGFVDVCLPPIR